MGHVGAQGFAPDGRAARFWTKPCIRGDRGTVSTGGPMAERVEIEEGDREPPSRGESPAAVALAHALEAWRAERENARELATRRAGLCTVTVAALGLGVFRIGGLEELHVPDWARAAMAVTLGLCLASLFGTLLHALDRGPSHIESVAFSSELLPLDAKLLGYSSPDQARLMSMKRLDLAARDQRARNEADLRHLGEIQTGLVWATLFAVLAVTAYLLSFGGGA
jgi:hypothetical protein